MTQTPDGWLSYEQVHGKNHTVTGTVVVWPGLHSAQLGATREICVYLPPSLARARTRAVDAAPARQYPVLYFHDGQNVFDVRTSYSGEWRADETLERLATEGIEALAVAVPNGGRARMDEYNPWRGPSVRRRADGIVGGKGDAYLDWLLDDVMPLIERSFPVRRDRAARGVIGSSLGGLISLYALTKYPALFGMVGALSPSVRWHDFAILRELEKADVPPTRIHVDMGGREWRGMTEDARRLRKVLEGKGWVKDRDLHYVEERYAIHREDAWARRLPDALRFLLADVTVAPVGRSNIEHTDISRVTTG